MEKILQVINVWDPLGVFGLAPLDEYKSISEKVCEMLGESPIQEQKIKKFLISQYGDEMSKNKEKVDEVYSLLLKVT